MAEDGVYVDTESVQRMLDEQIERIETVDVALEEAGELILEENKAKWGKGWKAESAEKEGEPGVETGRLKAAMTKRGAAGQRFDVADNLLSLGITKDIYPDHKTGPASAYTFSKGGKYPGGKRSGGLRQPKRRLQRGSLPSVWKKIEALIAHRIGGDEHEEI